MGYIHIDNLYKNRAILLFKKCYALEKIHGTSANVKFVGGAIILFSGGEKHSTFMDNFDTDKLLKIYNTSFTPQDEIRFYGEAYGGKQHSMKDTYGVKSRFIVFDVKVNDYWLNVKQAENLTKSFGLEFVDYHLINTTLKNIDKEKDLPSAQATRNGCGDDKKREGIVLRPLIELTDAYGNRIIAKHKTGDFIETKTPRSVSEKELKLLKEAQEIADEWVTPMRLKHILDKIPDSDKIENIPIVIKYMVEDVYREGKDEILESKPTRKAISRNTVRLFKEHLKNIKGDEDE